MIGTYVCKRCGGDHYGYSVDANNANGANCIEHLKHTRDMAVAAKEAAERDAGEYQVQASVYEKQYSDEAYLHEQAKARIAALEAALRRYGRHTNECHIGHRFVLGIAANSKEDFLPHDGSCTCGLDTALATGAKEA